MGLLRKSFTQELPLKRKANLNRCLTNLTQKPIINPCAIPETAATNVKTKPWHKNNINLTDIDILFAGFRL
jgi:hypothetical protein